MPEHLHEPEGKYIAHCHVCLTTTNLVLIPHRRDGHMVGWVFGCVSCAPNLYGACVLIEKREVVELPLETDSI